MEKKWEITPFILRFLTCSLTEVVVFFSFLFFLNSKANLKVWKNKMEHSDPKSSVYVAGI